MPGARWRQAVWALIFALFATAGAHAEGRRIALLIGNAAYTADVGPLKNPEHDVLAIRDTLISIGFDASDIQVVPNARRVEINRAIDQLADRAKDLKPTDVVFFYYSGHGAVRAGGKGMSLIPTDVSNPTTSDFWYDTVSLDDDVIKRFKAANSQAAWILAIDACRSELKLPSKALGGGEKAFGVVPSSAGMLVSFAADEGETAKDIATGSNTSPYAEALIEELRRPGVSVSAVFSAVRPNVIRRTGGSQQPVSTNKLNVDPVLVSVGAQPSAASSSAATQPRQAAAPVQPPTSLPSQPVEQSAPDAPTDLAWVDITNKQQKVVAFLDINGQAENRFNFSTSKNCSLEMTLPQGLGFTVRYQLLTDRGTPIARSVQGTQSLTATGDLPAGKYIFQLSAVRGAGNYTATLRASCN